MARVDTLPVYLRPLMEGPSVQARRCVVCGKAWPLNQHHVVRRSAGKLYKQGVELPKPTLTLCGNGNVSGCHGLAHQQRLFFRWVPEQVEQHGYDMVRLPSGHWEYREFKEPTKALKAYGTKSGWKRCLGGDD